jgi:hypothetical protein
MAMFFCFQAACQKMLCRQVDGEYFQSIATVNRLNFPTLIGSKCCATHEPESILLLS